MKFFKQNPINLQFTDVTFKFKLTRILSWFWFLSFIAFLTSSYVTNKQGGLYVGQRDTIILHDTLKELIVLKHGMSEITVDRNANIPTFCNNPGALRPTSIKEVNELAIGKVQTPSGEFLHFANKIHGFKALEIVLRKLYWNVSIKDCIAKYAPPSENNTTEYINRLVNTLGCNGSTKVKDCNMKKLMNAIAEVEGFKG